MAIPDDAQFLQQHEAETMKQSKEKMDRVITSYLPMLGFYGADLDNEETGQLRRARNYNLSTSPDLKI